MRIFAKENGDMIILCHALKVLVGIVNDNYHAHRREADNAEQPYHATRTTRKRFGPAWRVPRVQVPTGEVISPAATGDVPLYRSVGPIRAVCTVI